MLYLARSGLCVVSRKKNLPGVYFLLFFSHAKSFIDQARSSTMAGYWPRSFFLQAIDLDSVSAN